MLSSTGAHRCRPHGLRAAGLTIALLVLALVPAVLLAQGLAGDLLLEAGRALDAEKWEEALKYYQAFIAQYPEHEAVPLAHFASGECLLNLQRHEQALASYRQVIDKYPDWLDVDDAHFRIGNCLFQLKQYGAAADCFTEMLDKYPDSDIRDKASYWLGEAQFQEGAKQPALEAYRKSLALAPTGEYAPYALYSIATIEAETDKQAALVSFRQLLERFPDSQIVPDALYGIGRVCEALQQFDEAITHYQRVIDEHPDSELAARASAGIGSVQFSQGDFAEASKTFRATAERYPGTEVAARSSLRAADALFAAKQYAEAARLYGEVAAEARNPYAATAAYWQALSYQQDERAEAAIAALNGFVEKYPEDENRAEAYLRLGALYSAADKLAEAQAAYEQAVAAGQDQELVLEAQYAAAWTAYQQERSAEHLAALKSLLVDNPQSRTAGRRALATAQLCLNEKQYQAALELAEVIVQHHPQHPNLAEALLMKGRSQRHLGQTEAARETLHKVLADYPESDWAEAARADLVLMDIAAGELAAAAQTIAEMRPDSPSAASRPQLLCLVAEAYYQDQEWDQATEMYQAAYDTDPKSAWGATGLQGAADSRLAARQYQKAADTYQEYLREFAEAPQAAQTRAQLGIALHGLGQYDAAIEQLKLALAAEPEASWAPPALMQLAETYLEANKPLLAGDAYLRIADNYPQHELAPDGLFWAGEQRYRQGNFATAAELYQRLLDEYGSSELADEAHYKLAWALLKTGHSQEALTHFRSASEAADNPQIACDARLQAGYLLMHQSEYAAAAEVLAPASDMTEAEQLPALLYLLGQAYLAGGEAAKAAPVLQRLVQEFSDSPYTPHAKLALARSYKELQQYEQAAEMLTELAASPEPALRAEAQFETADLSRLQNDFALAAELYVKVAGDEAPPELAAKALYAAGVCYEKIGQLKEATATYRQLVDGFPAEMEWVTRAKQRLEELGGVEQ